MSKTQLKSNNERLASLIDEIRGKAVGGGGSGSVETCTVTITVANVHPQWVMYVNSASDDGFVEWSPELPEDIPAPFEILNGTLFILSKVGSDAPTVSGGEARNFGNGKFVILANPGAGETCTVTT